MVLGIDIGGTNIKFGIVDEKYEIHNKYSIATEKDKGDVHLVQTIIQKAKEIKDEYDFKGIGIGSPGTIDSERGIAVCATNLPYDNTPVAEIIERALRVPVFLSNDADCAAYGEIHAGMGRLYNDFIMLTLGTGVGGSMVINKEIYHGNHERAGDFGHMVISHDGLECGCGRRGCFEKYASVTALIQQTKDAIEKNPQSILAKMGGNGVTGRTAFDAMRAGCSVGAAVVEQYIDYIFVGIDNLCIAIQPEAIVIGGAISNEGEYLIEPLKKKTIYCVDFVTSKLKNDAGLLGAAVMALTKMN